MSHSHGPPTSESPRRLGDYTILRLLGQGGMGTVYEAEELLSRRRVALKILHGDLGRTEQGRRQFLTEMAILASLDDPHIVRCLHCTEIDGQLVMALEYLEGRTLRHLLKERNALRWPEVAGIAWQITSALQVAHSRRPAIIHRDLKPENVMCLVDGRVKVMDFGIAKIVETMAGRTSSGPLGTLQYMSPEQIDARPVDGRSDLYSLGLTMWELLAGRPPFEADSPRVLLEKLCTEPAPPLPDYARWEMPPGAESLIARLLEKDPARRPRDAGEVLGLLHYTRTGPAPAVSTPAAPRPPNEPMPPPRTRHDTIAIVERAARGNDNAEWRAPMLIAGLVCLMLAIAVLGWIFVDRDSDSSPTDAFEASAARSSGPAGSIAADPSEFACAKQASDWVGAWTLATKATQAVDPSWIGGRSVYELDLTAEGCRLRGSGRKYVRGQPLWNFTVEGRVAPDGSATIDYDAVGRNIAGTWTLSKSGQGTWTSSADDVSGTVTASRPL